MRTETKNDPKDDRIEQLEQRCRDLELALGLGNDKLAATFHMPPQLKKVFGCLLAIPVVTQEMITGRLNLASEPKVLIQRLRNHLKEWAEKHNEAPIKVHITRGLGYYLEPEEKARVRELIKKYTGDYDAQVEAVTADVTEVA